MTAAQWITSTLKGALTNPRYADSAPTEGSWWARDSGLRSSPRTTTVGCWRPTQIRRPAGEARAADLPVLSGMLRCGKCKTGLYSSARTQGGITNRRYVCLSGRDHGGCEGTMITAEPRERLVADVVLYRLDTPELADALAGRFRANERTHELSTALDQATEHLEELARAYAPSATSRCASR